MSDGFDSARIVSYASPARAKSQLRLLLLLFFGGISLPLAFLLSRVYRQLENETLYQYRLSAEDLVERVNTRLQQTLDSEEARSFDEYNFYNVSNVPLQQAKALTFSPLAEFPPKTNMPGMVGYFQVNPDGSLQSPILPKTERGGVSETPSEIEGEQLARRVAAWDRLYNLLSGADKSGTDAKGGDIFADQKLDVTPVDKVKPAPSSSMYEMRGSSQSEMSEKEIAQVVLGSRNSTSQLAPERLLNEEETFAGARKVSDLNLDSKYLGVSKKMAPTQLAKVAPAAGGAEPQTDDAQQYSNQVQRARRKERVDVPVTAPVTKTPSDGSSPAAEGAGSRHQAQPAGGRSDDEAKKASNAIRVLTLEGEVDPFQFRVLDQLHLLFVRKVWRDGARYLQGFVLDGEPFFRDFIDSAFQSSPISKNSTMIIGYRGVFFRRVNATTSAPMKKNPDGREWVLYRSPLQAPYDRLELLITSPQLPTGPGVKVVNALALALALVLVSGLYGMYRLGVRHILFAKERGDFVSAVSHELKTPLTSIRMYSEMLRSGWVTDESKKKTYYDFIFSESERLSRLISNVLQFASLTHNDSPFILKPVLAEKLLETAKARVQSQVESCGFALELCYEGPKELLHVDIEEDAFSRIAINLVDNAIKFSTQAERKTIVLAVKATDSGDPEVVFSVRDFGPGVPRERMKKIFRLFYRGEDEMNRSTPGTGIGLALVNELATKMNASVDLKNHSPGAEFLVKFPATRVEPE
ncbi:MAG: HAMP domain-containing sensor histidine kinase [Bdellovibrionota bacterium]